MAEIMIELGFFKRFRQRDDRPHHLALGEYGERIVAEFLQGHGYRIVATNYTAPIGYSQRGRRITGEIDIVAYDEARPPYTLAFIEVKTRSSDYVIAPESAVDLRKRRQIIKTARKYRRINELINEPYRFDVVSVIAKPGYDPVITLHRGFFTEDMNA
jgi:putative endonuclease